MSVASTDTTTPLLRRGLLGLGALTAAGIAVELAVERHWTQPIQFVAWGAVVVVAVTLGLLAGAPGRARVRLARMLAVLVLLTAAWGIWEHIYANYDAGPLDLHYTDTWDSLPETTRWWLALTKTVGPSPPLAPGALALASLCVLLAALRHPALASRDTRDTRDTRSTAPLEPAS
jgi:hypothetical protein